MKGPKPGLRPRPRYPRTPEIPNAAFSNRMEADFAIPVGERRKARGVWLGALEVSSSKDGDEGEKGTNERKKQRKKEKDKKTDIDARESL